MKNLFAAFQAKIDPLVNKVRVHKYQKVPPILIYPMYLNPPSSSYQRVSWSHVFTSYLDPAINSKLHLPLNSFFQCFPHAPKLLSILRMDEVSVWAKNRSRMCRLRGRSRRNFREMVQIIIGKQSLTLKYCQGFLSDQSPYDFVSNKDLYIVVSIV